MPTMTGTIWGHSVGYREVYSGGGSGIQNRVDDVSLNLHFRDISADSAISLLTHTGKSIWAECGFSSINIIQSGIEDHDPAVPRVVRKGVGFLTFRTAVVECKVRSRWSIHHWNKEPQASVSSSHIDLNPEACFLGYDAATGEVFYTHEVLSKPGIEPIREGAMCLDTVKRIVVRDFTGRNVDVIEAPSDFVLVSSANYRVNPKTQSIEPINVPCSFKDMQGLRPSS